jgi:hypothetical protein
MSEKFLVRVNDVYTGAITGESFKVLKVYISNKPDVKLSCSNSGKTITASVNYIQYMINSGGFI